MHGQLMSNQVHFLFSLRVATALEQRFSKTGYAQRVVVEECKKSGVSLTELRSGSRRGRLLAVRTTIVRGLVENYGVGVEVARQVGMSTSRVSRILMRTFVQLVNSVPTPSTPKSL